MSERMTDEEFDIAHKRLSWRIGWASMLFAVPWFAGFMAIGITYRDWSNRHDNASLLVLGVFVGGFLTAAYVISRWLHKRSGLVCPTYGRKEFLSPTGGCWNCNPLPRVVRRFWAAVIIGLGGGAVGTIASTTPRAVWNTVAGGVCRGVRGSGVVEETRKYE